MRSYAFLFWGDVIVWTGLTLYVVVMVRKVASLSRRLESIESRNARGNPSAS